MSDLITAEEAGKLLDEVAQNQPKVCMAWCLKSAEDCLCYKAKIAEGALYNAAPDLARTVIALHADRDRLAAAIREAALREALDAAAAETDRLRAAKKKHAHKSDIKGEAMAEGAFQVATALAGLIDIPRKEVMPDVRNYQDTAHDTAPAGLSAGGGAGWQPIETAPRDGSRFLGYWPSSGRDGDVAVTTWWDAFEGFWESPFESADYGADYGPTRWMPHPPATEGI